MWGNWTGWWSRNSTRRSTSRWSLRRRRLRAVTARKVCYWVSRMSPVSAGVSVTLIGTVARVTFWRKDGAVTWRTNASTLATSFSSTDTEPIPNGSSSPPPAAKRTPPLTLTPPPQLPSTLRSLILRITSLSHTNLSLFMQHQVRHGLYISFIVIRIENNVVVEVTLEGGSGSGWN